MEIHYKPQGVCSRAIDVELDGNIIKSVRFTGGCSGNTQGVSVLAQGMTVEEYIKRCKDIKCGMKKTSCPAQLALALEQALSTTH